MNLTLQSFGFDNGPAPEDAVWVGDVRDIPTSAIAGAEDQDGRDPGLRERIMATSAAQAWQRKFDYDVLTTLADGDLVAFGCSAGQHRSVAIVETIAESLIVQGHSVTVEHRDVVDRVVEEPANRDTAESITGMSVTPIRNWYEIRNAASSDVAEVYIYDQIGADWFSDGVTAKSFLTELAGITAPNIALHLNSPGGSVFDGVAIYNALDRHPAKVTTYVDGLAASIASIIALAGERVVMASNALFMIHNPSGGVRGEAADMRKMADVLDKIKDTLVGTYASRTTLSTAELSDLLDAETWYTAEEALAAGFVDEVSAPVQAAAHFDLDQFPFRNRFEPVAAIKDSDTDGASNVGNSSGALETPKPDTYIPGVGFTSL